MDPYNVNPYWDVYKNSNDSDKDLFRLHASAVYNITSHLKVKGTAGAELNWFSFDDFKAPTTPGYESGYLQQSQFKNRMYNFELIATYNNRWGDFDSQVQAAATSIKSTTAQISPRLRKCRFAMWLRL